VSFKKILFIIVVILIVLGIVRWLEFLEEKPNPAEQYLRDTVGSPAKVRDITDKRKEQLREREKVMDDYEK